MDLKQLQYFVRIVELKSLTRAAAQLRIAQPALGFHIRKLEAEMETQLLVRHSRGVEPTEAGLVLLDHARRLLDDANRTKETLRQFAGAPRGKLTLGMAPSFGYEFSTKVVLHCLSEMPDVSLNLVQELAVTLMEWLRADRIDLACAGRFGESGFVYEPLFSHDICLIGAPHHEITDRDPISFAEVTTYPLILPSARFGLRARLEGLAKELALPLHVTCEVQSDVLAMELVKQSVGFTILTHTAVRREVEEGKLIARRIIEPQIPTDACIVYKDRRPLSQAATAVRALIRKLVQEEMSRMDGIWRLPEES